MNLSEFAGALNKIIMPRMLESMGLDKPALRGKLINKLNEYNQLTNRYWKRKRELKDYIFSLVINLSDEIIEDVNKRETRNHQTIFEVLK